MARTFACHGVLPYLPHHLPGSGAQRNQILNSMRVSSFLTMRIVLGAEGPHTKEFAVHQRSSKSSESVGRSPGQIVR